MIRYDELKSAAKKVRAEMTEKGLIDPSVPKIRKKPRDDEKANLLYTRAINRLKEYPPKISASNSIIFPYFKL